MNEPTQCPACGHVQGLVETTATLSEDYRPPAEPEQSVLLEIRLTEEQIEALPRQLEEWRQAQRRAEIVELEG